MEEPGRRRRLTGARLTFWTARRCSSCSRHPAPLPVPYPRVLPPHRPGGTPCDEDEEGDEEVVRPVVLCEFEARHRQAERDEHADEQQPQGRVLVNPPLHGVHGASSAGVAGGEDVTPYILAGGPLWTYGPMDLSSAPRVGDALWLGPDLLRSPRAAGRRCSRRANTRGSSARRIIHLRDAHQHRGDTTHDVREPGRGDTAPPPPGATRCVNDRHRQDRGGRTTVRAFKIGRDLTTILQRQARKRQSIGGSGRFRVDVRRVKRSVASAW